MPYSQIPIYTSHLGVIPPGKKNKSVDKNRPTREGYHRTSQLPSLTTLTARENKFDDHPELFPWRGVHCTVGRPLLFTKMKVEKIFFHNFIYKTAKFQQQMSSLWHAALFLCCTSTGYPFPSYFRCVKGVPDALLLRHDLNSALGVTPSGKKIKSVDKIPPTRKG